MQREPSEEWAALLGADSGGDAAHKNVGLLEQAELLVGVYLGLDYDVVDEAAEALAMRPHRREQLLQLKHRWSVMMVMVMMVANMVDYNCYPILLPTIDINWGLDPAWNSDDDDYHDGNGGDGDRHGQLQLFSLAYDGHNYAGA